MIDYIKTYMIIICISTNAMANCAKANIIIVYIKINAKKELQQRRIWGIIDKRSIKYSFEWISNIIYAKRFTFLFIFFIIYF